jgi:hypothetical protein
VLRVRASRIRLAESEFLVPGVRVVEPAPLLLFLHVAAIDLEVWAVPEDRLGGFVAQVPAPLAIGKVELADGRWITGFVCEAVAQSGARDITHLGGWRRYIESRVRE